MTETVLAALTTLTLGPREAQRLGLAGERLRLRRAWPRSPDRLGLEYVTGQGRLIPGQWFNDPGRLERVARATAKASPRSPVVVAGTGQTRVLLQADGADRRLPALSPLLARPGTKLVVHRPERRAVVRLASPAGLRYAKVVRPERLAAIVGAARAVRNGAKWAFATPELVEMDPGRGLVIWAELPGARLSDLVQNQWLVAAAGRAGQALRALHAIPAPETAGRHGANDEIALLRRWLERIEPFGPQLMPELRAAAAPVFERLAAASSPAVLLHRDFYDKQVVVDAHGRVGLLDFDTLATGEAALDLANALGHFELRAIQGHLPTKVANKAAVALLDGYRPNTRILARLGPYVDATRLRLACVYALRPGGQTIVPALLARIGQPTPGLLPP